MRSWRPRRSLLTLLVSVQYVSCGEKLCLRVVLIHVTVLLLVQVLGLLLGVSLGLLAVDVVQALGLEELVDLGAGDTSNHLLSKLVLDGLAYVQK